MKSDHVQFWRKFRENKIYASLKHADYEVGIRFAQ